MIELDALREINAELVAALKALADEAFINMRGGAGHLIDDAYAAVAKARAAQ